jgi:hypothetical protein
VLYLRYFDYICNILVASKEKRSQQSVELRAIFYPAENQFAAHEKPKRQSFKLEFKHKVASGFLEAAPFLNCGYGGVSVLRSEVDYDFGFCAAYAPD